MAHLRPSKNCVNADMQNAARTFCSLFLADHLLVRRESVHQAARCAWPTIRLRDNIIVDKPAQSMSQLVGSGIGEV